MKSGHFPEISRILICCELSSNITFGKRKEFADWIGPSYSEHLPEGGEGVLSKSEREKLENQHKIPTANEIEYIPLNIDSIVIKIHRQVVSENVPKNNKPMTIEEVSDGTAIN